MQCEYKSEEDRSYLSRALWLALAATDNIFSVEFKEDAFMEYRDVMLKLRKKVCGFLEMPDPNEHIIRYWNSQKQ